MKKNAVVFLDFNETFDDICEGKGKIFFWSFSKFISHFSGNVDVVIITAAPTGNPNFSIRPEFKQTTNYFSKEILSHFKFLIEHNSTHITKLEHRLGIDFGETLPLCHEEGTKKDGVEKFVNEFSDTKYDLAVFAGNSEESDLIMMDAQIDVEEKYFLLANRRILKAPKYPVYQMSFEKQNKSYNYGKVIFDEVKNQNELIIKTSTKSYGLGKGFEALTDYLKEKDN